MSVQAMSWVIENSRAKSGDFVVLLMVANYANDDGTGAWPSVATLAKKSRLGVRETQYCLRRLMKIGELSVEIGAGPRGTNSYRVNLQQGCIPLQGAKTAGVQSTSQKDKKGCSPLRQGEQPTAPDPSLTTLKDNRPLEATPILVPLSARVEVVPVEVWLSFVEMRKKIRAPLTERAGELIRKELEKLADQGEDPVACLEQSIARSWRGVFPIHKENGKEKEHAPQSFAEKRSRTSAAAIQRVLGDHETQPRQVRAALPSTTH